YQQILALQASRQPFDVITGKRKYQNMLIRAIEVTTDKHTETVLMAILTLRELNITETQTLNIKSTDAKNMREGNTTGGVSNTGMKTPKPIDNRSLLQRGAAFFNGN
ncbi:MAG TPA: phage baseplate protein, partial [Arsenophonus nasoniae]